MKKRLIMIVLSLVLAAQSGISVAASDNTDDSTGAEIYSTDTDAGNVVVDGDGQADEQVQSVDADDDITLFADDEVFTQASGTYSTDTTQPIDGNWHIVKWLTDKPLLKRDSNDYKKDGVLHYFMQTQEDANGGVPYTYVTGGVPEGSAITRFTIDASNVGNSAFLEVYASSNLDAADDEWTKLKASEKKSNGMQGNLSVSITYAMSASDGYRYIKVLNTSTKREAYYYRLGGFSFDWVDPFELRENEVRVKVDGSQSDYISEKSDSIKELSSDNYGGYLGFDEADNEAYVMYAAPEGKCFKYFYVDVANADNANILAGYEIGISQKSNGKFFTMNFSDATSQKVAGFDNGSRFEWDEIDTRYIKFKIYPGSNYEYFKLGTFGFELMDYDENRVNELYTFEADTTSKQYSDWSIISVTGPCGLYNWSQYISNTKGEHFFLGGSDGQTTDIIIGGIPVRNGIREFTVETFYNRNGIEVYAAKEQDGEYVKISEEFSKTQPYSWNDGGNNVAKHVFRMRAAEGYRYIKLRMIVKDWTNCLGQITYTYGSIDGPEAYHIICDMNGSGNKMDINLTAKTMLEVQNDVSAYCLLTTYKDGKLTYASKQKVTLGNTVAELSFKDVPFIDFAGGDEAQLTFLTYLGDRIKFVIPSKNLEE